MPSDANDIYSGMKYHLIHRPGIPWRLDMSWSYMGDKMPSWIGPWDKFWVPDIHYTSWLHMKTSRLKFSCCLMMMMMMMMFGLWKENWRTNGVSNSLFLSRVASYCGMNHCKRIEHVNECDRSFFLVDTCSCKSVRQCLKSGKGKSRKKNQEIKSTGWPADSFNKMQFTDRRRLRCSFSLQYSWNCILMKLSPRIFLSFLMLLDLSRACQVDKDDICCSFYLQSTIQCQHQYVTILLQKHWRSPWFFFLLLSGICLLQGVHGMSLPNASAK